MKKCIRKLFILARSSNRNNSKPSEGILKMSWVLKPYQPNERGPQHKLTHGKCDFFGLLIMTNKVWMTQKLHFQIIIIVMCLVLFMPSGHVNNFKVFVTIKIILKSISFLLTHTKERYKPSQVFWYKIYRPIQRKQDKREIVIYE